MNRKRFSRALIIALFLFVCLGTAACDTDGEKESQSSSENEVASVSSEKEPGSLSENESSSSSVSESSSSASKESSDQQELSSKSSDSSDEEAALRGSDTGFNISDVPAYSGLAYTQVNDNQPYFMDEVLTTDDFESYSSLDALGRCGVAYANICADTMPTEKRGEIGMVRPSGWHTVKYNDLIDGNYLYNRCHLIAYCLAGENANTKNLITGTRYLNVEGMLPFENKVAEYVEESDNHVIYRVTPVFEGNNLVASGVLMEAKSVEDNGLGICFCVYCYNIQPYINIDYATGESSVNEEAVAAAGLSDGQNTQTASSDATGLQASDGSTQNTEQAAGGTTENSAAQPADDTTATYIINTNTKVFHYPDCRSVGQMKEENKVYSHATRDEIIAGGYKPCGNCHP